MCLMSVYIVSRVLNFFSNIFKASNGRKEDIVLTALSCVLPLSHIKTNVEKHNADRTSRTKVSDGGVHGWMHILWQNN